MNAIFNITRFSNLMKREAISSWKQYAYMILGILAYFIIALIVDKTWNINMLTVLSYIYVLIVILWAPLIDKNMNSENSIFYFTLPVSTFERFLSIWFRCVIIVPVIILALLFSLDSISETLGLSKLQLTNLSWEQIFYSILVAQSLFILGQIFFRKRAFIKTLLGITASFIIIILLSKLIIAVFYPEIIHIKNVMDPIQIVCYSGYIIKDGEAFRHVATDTTPIYEAAKYVLMAIFPLGIWTLSFLKLRETDI